MKIEETRVTGFILAGGNSSRMGSDKASRLFQGKPLIQHVIEQLRTEVDSVIIVSGHPDHSAFGKPVIPDLIKQIGPAGGIYTALLHSTTENNFIVSCDMPFITSKGIQYLIRQSHGFEITIPLLDFPQPLFGVYSKSCLPTWKSLIKSGQLSLRQMITHFNLQLLPVKSTPIFGKNFFSNLNSPSDLESFKDETKEDNE